MSRILGRLITGIPTTELAFTVHFLENQQSETFSAGGDLHPKFIGQLQKCKAELLKRNINELPQAMLDLCGYPRMGAYD